MRLSITKLKSQLADRRQRFRSSVRFVIVIALLQLAFVFLYFGVSSLALRLALVFDVRVSAWVVLIGLGVAALLTLYLASPLVIRFLFACRRVNDPTLTTLVERSFRNAKLPIPSVWALPFDKPHAVIAGLVLTQQTWRPALFVGCHFQETFTSEEINAILAHEIAHLKLHHLRKRLCSVITGVTLTILSLIVIATAIVLFAPSFPLSYLILVGFTIGLFVPHYSLRKQSRRHELEADHYALSQLSIDPAIFAQMLGKLNDAKGITHPTTKERVLALVGPAKS